MSSLAPWLCLLPLLCTVPAVAVVPIAPAPWSALHHGSGDDVAVGWANSLHHVFLDQGTLAYTTSLDGQSWTTPVEIVPPNGGDVHFPAVAVDRSGTVAVVFVGDYDEQTELGSIYYATRPPGTSAWSVQKIVELGTEPDIAALDGRVYVAWTTFERVDHFDFPIDAPPTPALGPWDGQKVYYEPEAHFTHPSVAVVLPPCGPPKPWVAFLGGWQRRAGSIPYVGILVSYRDDWGFFRQGFIDLAESSSSELGVSLSLNAQWHSGHVYVAWSWVAQGVERTALAHTDDYQWVSMDLANEAYQIHVQADPESADGFRVAWVENGALPWVSRDAYHRSGRWSGQASPTWTEPAPVPLTSPSGPRIGRPQAAWWERCHVVEGRQDIRSFFETEDLCPGSTVVANDYRTGLPCTGRTAVIRFPCGHHFDVIFGWAHDRHWVDTTSLGSLVSMGPDHAIYDAGNGATARLDWVQGQVVETWPGGFSATGLQGLTVSGQGITPTLVDLGYLPEYDDVCADPCACGS